MRHVAVRTIACIALVAGTVPALAGPGLADEGSLEVGNAAEAWYRVAEGVDPCTLPVGCPGEPVPKKASTYPDGTLHVEAVAGEPTAHSYLLPDLAELPPLSSPVGGTLTLPLSAEPESGNVNVEAAKIVACLATEPIDDGVYGGTSGSPDYDCEETSSPARFHPKQGTFTVDLDPFLEHWAGGSPAYGIALVPGHARAPQAPWQVSFNGSGPGRSPKCVSSLTYRDQVEPPSTALPTAPDLGPAPSGSGRVDASASLGTPEVPPAPELAPAPPAEARAAQPRTAPVSLVNGPWYAYRGVVFLPLAFLVALVISGRTLTRPLIR